MAPPLYVKLVTVAVNAVFLAAGARDVLFTGRPHTTWPDHLTLDQFGGVLMATIALAKIVMCFLPHEGQLLRLYLFQLYAASDLVCMVVVDRQAAPGVVALWGIEAATFTYYALVADRRLKKKVAMHRM